MSQNRTNQGLLLGPFCRLTGTSLEPLANFQTVSLRSWVNKGKRKKPLSPPSLPLRLQTRNLAPTLMSGLSHYFNGEVTVARGTETRHERLALGSPLVYFEARRGT